MHGRPRKPKDVVEAPERLKAREKKLLQYRELTNKVLSNVSNFIVTKQSLEEAAVLLQKNPDVYTIWNYRRLALADKLKGSEGQDVAKQTAAAELSLTEAALQENPKSYPTWNYRLWLMKLGLHSFLTELKQVSRFLELDSRNFLAWRYRREIVKLAGVSPEEELEYAQKLIDKNFSNYSAWHARSSLLVDIHLSKQVVSFADLLANKVSDAPKVLSWETLEEEFDLVQQAFFTDPEDQSAYIYHKWLLQVSMAHLTAANTPETLELARKELERVLRREEACCRELLEIEPDQAARKWPLLTLCNVLLLQQNAGLALQDAGEPKALLLQLTATDPLRKGFYEELSAKQP